MNNLPSTIVREYFPNVLIISGSGRDRGKTLLVCNILRKWENSEQIVAVKISAHTHDQPHSMNLIHRSTGYSIWEETATTQKDSGKFLKSGAAKVFYVEANDHELLKAFRFISGLCSEQSLIVCESGGLGKFIRPGVMIFVQHVDEMLDVGKTILRNLSHRIIYSSSPELSDPSLLLKITDHQWKLVTRDQDVT